MVPSAGWLGGEVFAQVARPQTGNGIGLVIVPPFGFEGVCAHRALRHLADRAARAGLVTVRVDVHGTGDSEGDDLERARVEAWVSSIERACDLARAERAERIVLCGVRIGAMLAALAAERRDDVAGLVAIAAPPVGKAWVREAKMMQSALGLAAAPDGANGDEELVGFALTSETRNELARIDLTKATRRPAPSVLVIDRDDLPGNDKWVAQLRSLGAEVEQVRLPGYVQMVLDPHRAEVPDQILEAAVEFACRRPAMPATPAREVVLAQRSRSHDEVVTFDGLVAVASHPASPPACAVILLNAGAIRRIGPNRLHVALGRRLAAEGMLVLRLDQSGLGDSPPRGGPDNIVYSDHAVADVGRAVAWARSRGARRVVVVGLCSGAYHAQKAAAAGHPIDAIVPINPLTFFWTADTPLDAQAFRVTSEAERYAQSMWSGKAWRKLVRGEIDVKRVAGILGRRVRNAIEHRGRDVLRRLGVPLARDLGSELRALARRGVRMHFIFTASDPGRAMLVEQGGRVVEDLAGTSLSILTIDGPDHTFTPRWSHPVLLDAIASAVRAVRDS